MNQKKLAHPMLPVAELLLLDRLNGRLVGEELTQYGIEEYGTIYASGVQNLKQGGYLQFAEPAVALEWLQVPRLKDILRTNNQKLSGNKAELVSRIIKNIPQDKYLKHLPSIYVATEQGRLELERRWAYIENQRYGCGFLNSEIEELEKINAAVDILEQLFKRDIIKHSMAGDWGLLRNRYYELYKHYKHHSRVQDSLMAMLSVLYIDLTGMQNNNGVEVYKNMGWVLETSVWRNIDQARAALKLSDAELKEAFVSTSAKVSKPPFSYFGVETMAEIMIERLHGQADLLKRYKKYSNKPRENAREYVYYEI